MKLHSSSVKSDLEQMTLCRYTGFESDCGTDELVLSIERKSFRGYSAISFQGSPHPLHSMYQFLASNPGLLPPRGKKLRDLLTPSERKGGRRPGRFHHVMLAAGDVTSYKQYIFYIGI